MTLRDFTEELQSTERAVELVCRFTADGSSVASRLAPAPEHRY